MAGDAFTREKFEWLDRVSEDVRVSAGAFRLAYVLASRFLSRQHGVAYPSQETLATALAVTDRQVRTHVGELVHAGHMVVRRGGRGHANRYVLAGFDRNQTSGQSGGVPASRPEQNFRSSADDRKFLVQMTGSELPPNPMREPKGGSGAPDGAPTGPAPDGAAGKIDEAFVVFRETYPKPVDPALVDLFGELITGGVATADEILKGARRAAARGSFATAAGPWLRGHGWTKEPAEKPKRPSTRSARRESALAIMARRYAEEGNE